MEPEETISKIIGLRHTYGDQLFQALFGGSRDSSRDKNKLNGWRSIVLEIVDGLHIDLGT